MFNFKNNNNNNNSNNTTKPTQEQLQSIDFMDLITAVKNQSEDKSLELKELNKRIKNGLDDIINTKINPEDEAKHNYKNIDMNKVQQMNLLDSYLYFMGEYYDTITDNERESVNIFRIVKKLLNFPLDDNGNFRDDDVLGKEAEYIMEVFMSQSAESNVFMNQCKKSMEAKKAEYLNSSNIANIDEISNKIKSYLTSIDEYINMMSFASIYPLTHLVTNVFDLFVFAGLKVDKTEENEEDKYMNVYISVPKYSQIGISGNELASQYKAFYEMIDKKDKEMDENPEEYGEYNDPDYNKYKDYKISYKCKIRDEIWTAKDFKMQKLSTEYIKASKKTQEER